MYSSSSIRNLEKLNRSQLLRDVGVNSNQIGCLFLLKVKSRITWFLIKKNRKLNTRKQQRCVKIKKKIEE